MTRLLAALTAAVWLLWAWVCFGCSSEPPRPDAGADARPVACGELGQACCTEAPRCAPELECVARPAAPVCERPADAGAADARSGAPVCERCHCGPIVPDCYNPPGCDCTDAGAHRSAPGVSSVTPLSGP